VLVLLSVIDPVFLHFEITPDRTVLFYLGVFTSILAVSRGMVPATNQVFDPELLLTEVVGYVHYMPESWEDRLHSHQVSISHVPPEFDSPLAPGTRRVQQDVPDEVGDFRARDRVGHFDAVHPSVFTAAMRW
jgi:hypothetical protein